MEALIEARSVTFSYGSQEVLRDVSFAVRQGDFVGILGPNGSGKTTLLRCLTGILRPSSGAVMLAGREVSAMARKDIARLVAVVPQETEVHFDFTVEELVAMGRLPYLGRFQKEGPDDREKVEWAMEVTGIEDLRRRPVTLLSGGEKQRAVLAKALAQRPRVLLLDEPTSHFDLRYQVEMLDLSTRLNREEGITVVAVLHDTNLAAAYCRDMIMLSGGGLFARGSTEDVFTPGNIGKLYGLDVVSMSHPVTGDVLVFPARLKGRRGSISQGDAGQPSGGGDFQGSAAIRFP